MIYDDQSVRDKILAGQEVSTQEFEETIELYRQLRINFEKRLMYPEAGEFHIGEMGARKLAISNDMSKKRFVRRIEGAIFHIYKWISLYGESYIRPFACIMGLVSLCAILYGFSGVKSGNTEIKYVFTLQHFQCKNCFEFFSELWIYSLMVATVFLRERPFTVDTPLSLLVFIVESIAGAILVFCFIMAVKRKFKRIIK